LVCDDKIKGINNDPKRIDLIFMTENFVRER